MHAINEARKLARDSFLREAHGHTCRGISVRELAFVVCVAQGLKADHVYIIEQRLKTQLHDYRVRMGILPCSPRGSRRRRMPPLSEAS